MQNQNRESKSGSSSAASETMQSHSVFELDLEKEFEALRRSPEWESGIARKTMIRYPDLQITLRAMRAGTHIPEHRNPGRVSVQTVRGHIRMHADGKVFDLPQGRILIMDRAVAHDVEAVDESAFLLTVAPTGE